MRITKGLLIIGLCLVMATGLAFAGDKKLKAGFVYVGPVGDYGWSHAHDMGRKYAEKKLPWLETIFVESVGEADSARIIDRLIQEEKCDVVFTTSFGIWTTPLRPARNTRTSTSCTVRVLSGLRMSAPISATFIRRII